MDYADLELGIHQSREQIYRIDFRLSMPSFDTDIRAASRKLIEVQFDFPRLLEVNKLPEYSQRLTEQLFSEPALRVAFARSRALAAHDGKPLRFRLFIGPSAPNLHELHWETLRDPETNISLTTDENVLFSRYLASADEHPVKLRQKGSLHGLVAIASPEGHTPIPVEEELERARKGLIDVALTCLPDGDRRATLENILENLHVEPMVDVLYIVCHGVIHRGQPFIFLENEIGKELRIDGETLASRIQQMQYRPRLVILVSCQSAGIGTGGSFSAIAPRLIDIGVPAVVAMQDNISMNTAARFMPTFFRELNRDGQIDRAMAAARAAVSDCIDAWVPVLYMRLKSGRLWYKPGFSEISKATQKLPALCQNIEKKKLTPILGPGLVEPLLGSQGETARRWAVDFNYPLSPHERESLPQVAQYLSIIQQSTFPVSDLELSLKKFLIEKLYEDFSENISNLMGSLTLNQLMEQAAAIRLKTVKLDPYQVLASFDLPIYITANQDNLLEMALRKVGKSPRIFICPWNNLIHQPDETDLAELEEEEGQVDCPIVYHLFGTWDQPNSIVLTEDDYFRFLISIARKKYLIPFQVRQALVDSSLLFLGFQIEAWSFRVIFHSLLSQPGASRRNLYAHIAAQIEPEDERLVEPTRARQYLEQYFSDQESAKIDIYWGSPEDFISDLVRYYEKH